MIKKYLVAKDHPFSRKYYLLDDKLLPTVAIINKYFTSNFLNGKITISYCANFKFPMDNLLFPNATIKEILTRVKAQTANFGEREEKTRNTMVPFERLPQLILTEAKEQTSLHFTYQIETFSFKDTSYSASLYVATALKQILEGILLGSSSLVSDLSVSLQKYQNFNLLAIDLTPTMLGLENVSLILARLLKGISQLPSFNTHDQYLKLRNALETKYLTMERIPSYELTRILSQAPAASTDAVNKYMKSQYCLADYDPVATNKVIEKLNANNLLVHVSGWFERHSSASTTGAAPDFNLQDALSRRITTSEWKRHQSRPEPEWKGSLVLTRADPASTLFYHVQNIDEAFWTYIEGLARKIPAGEEAGWRVPPGLDWLLVEKEALESEYRQAGVERRVEAFEPVAAGGRVYYRRNEGYGSPLTSVVLRLRFDSFPVGSIAEHSNMLLREKIWQRRISPLRRVLESLNGHLSVTYSERSLLLTIACRARLMPLVIDQLLQRLDFIASTLTKDEFHQSLESLFAAARKSALLDLPSTMIDFKRRLTAGEYSQSQTMAEISNKLYMLQEERKNPFIAFGHLEGPVELITAVGYLEKLQQTYPV